ncbi:MAG TPA: glucose-6-phosphate isomerase [Thermodesulfobacteriota bacterium]|nr:glucose-6-phosphate isomerase [Thermodesulfobacteriota bacterium]
MNEITLDLSNALSSNLGNENGITKNELSEFESRVRKALNRIKEESSQGKLPFMGLPCLKTEEIEKTTNALLKDGFEDFILLGIGGSSLGARALKGALVHPEWNLLSKGERKGYPRAFILENIDPYTFSAVLETINIKKTIFNVVSKSGKTPETVSQFLIVKDILQKAVGSNWKRHIVITTDPLSGPLRKIAREEKIVSLSVPQGVGGRFSVLSSVALFPAAMMGIDIRRLLKGASELDACISSERLDENIAMALSAFYYLTYKKGKYITVLMPYSDRLIGFGSWFRQLWAESLGKKKANQESEGFTPVVALGATDQHSQLQLYLEGPNDKTITFIEVEDYESEIEIPKGFDKDEFSYLYGNSLQDLIRAELSATRRVLTSNGRPNVTLSIPRVSPESIGGIMFFYEVVTTLMGYLLEINPFDQPAVEEGKRITKDILEGKEELSSEEKFTIDCVSS